MATSEVAMTVERTGPTTTPAVSVCIPLYNKARFVGRTIQSVLDQTYTDFELVILDNASTDGSADVVRSFDDSRIVLLHNTGTVAMREDYNRVTSASRASVVKVLNADDLIEPTALERQVTELDRDPAVVIVSCRQSIIDQSGEVFARAHCLRTPDLIGRQDRAAVVRRVVRHGSNPIGNPGNLLFRRAAFNACGGWRHASVLLDVGLCTELVRHGDFYGIPEDLAVFRLAPQSHSTSARTRYLLETRRFVRRLAREHRDVVRLRDRIVSALRVPVTSVGSTMFLGASSRSGSLAHRVATRVMARHQRPVETRPRGT